MIPRKIFKEVGLFDSYMFPIHLSEVEFAQRLNRKGYIIALIPEARVWHDAPPYIVRAKGMDNARAFYTLRNRIILARRRSPLYLLFFTYYVLPLLLIYHMKIAYDIKDLSYLRAIIKGVIDGFKRG
jgi:GT2 family glycosyltransferase